MRTKADMEESTEPTRTAEKGLDLGGRLALRPKEAAEALGLSERTFREWLPRIPHIREGNVVLVPVGPLERWLDAQAQAAGSRVDATVREILGVSSGS